MKEVINQQYAFSLGFEYFDVHKDWFVMSGSGSPSIKGEINKGKAMDVKVYFDTIPVGLNALSPDRWVKVDIREVYKNFIWSITHNEANPQTSFSVFSNEFYSITVSADKLKL